MNSTSRVWLGRAIIGTVVIINLQCAFVFLINPAGFTSSYELIGIPGQAAIRGIAILFIMWNVPYIVSLINPAKYRVSLYEAIVMQSIGLIGESLILWSLPMENQVLRDSIFLFIIFDCGGLAGLIIAALITNHPVSNEKYR